MALSENINDLEKAKFLETGSGETAVRISGSVTPSLPTGAASEAKQDIANASLASIDTKLTSPLSVAQSGTWSIGRTWVLDFSTDDVTAIQGGTWSVGRTWTLSSGSDSVSSVQSGNWDIRNITGTISLPTGAAIASKQPAIGTAGTASTDVITVQGIASMTALKVDGSAVTQPISGTVTANQGTNPWVTSRSWNLSSGTDSVAAVQSGTWNITNVSGTVSLPTGASTSALQTTGNSSLSSIDGKLGTLGQKAMAGSAPVVLASDQSAIPVSQSGTWNITNISGTVSLPTGAATSAKQPALGTAGTASSDVITVQGIASMTALKVDGSGVTQPISGTVAATQSGTWTVQPGNTANTVAWKVDGSSVTQPISAASLPLPSGAATAAKQPALGTAGTASADVITIQGVASMTPIKTDSKTALTASSPTAATVGVTSASVVASNSSRKGLAVVNTSSNTISFGIGAAAVLNSGITLFPGGTWVMDEFNFTTAAINAIASAASSNLAIQEFT